MMRMPAMLKNAIKNIAACAMFAGAVVTFNAHADVWVRMDDAGVGHFSSERLDDRYVLYYKAPVAKSMDGSGAGNTANAAVTRPPALKEFSPKLAEFFETSPRYRKIQPLLKEAAHKYRIDVELLQALIAAESAFNASAVSVKGAVGLMQVMPDTARRFGVDSDRWLSVETKLADPRINVQIGARYLRLLLDMFPGKLELAVASYNAGEGAVMKAGNAIPNFKETKAYVAMVMELYSVLKPPALLEGLNAKRVRAEFYAPGMALNTPRAPYTLVVPGSGHSASSPLVASARGNMVPPFQRAASPDSNISAE